MTSQNISNAKPEHTLDELSDNFAFFEDWEERYRYLIDLGRALPKMDESLKTDDRIVKGCTSRVWMETNIKNNEFYFIADSDAHIVRGLIALLYAAYQGQKVTKLKDIDIEKFFSKIGLNTHLSPNRRNGFFSMVEKIKNLTV